MSDIFISYSSKDRSWVQPFAKLLELRGWSVWWDRQIPTGESFDSIIEQELKRARCVIVIWSRESVSSDWVKTEAATAKKRKVLLPVLIDDANLPLEFSRLQTQSLSEWHENSSDAGFDQLVKDIARLLGAAQPTEVVTDKPSWKRLHSMWLVALPTALMVAAVIILMMVRIPTRFQVELTTTSIEFVIGSSTADLTSLSLLESMSLRSLSIDNYSAVSLEPEIIEVADPEKYNEESDAFPATAWTTLPVTNRIINMVGEDPALLPRIAVQRLVSKATLDSISFTKGSRVALETRLRPGEVTVKLQGQNHRLKLSTAGQFELLSLHTKLSGVHGHIPADRQELTYRVRLRNTNSAIEIVGQPDSLNLSMTLVEEPVSFFSGHTIPISAVDLTRFDNFGNRVNALVGETKITYPDFPKMDPISIPSHDTIALDGLNRFHALEISLDPKGKGIKAKFDGVATLVTKTGDFPMDRRLVAFDALWHNPQLAILCTIILWALPTTVGVFRFLKDFKR